MDTFDEAFRDLNAKIDAYSQDKPMKPLGDDMVNLSSIRMIPTLFSPRSSGRSKDRGDYAGHAQELTRALKTMPEGEKHLDPIVVYEAAGQDYCVDGHHRLHAYRKAKVAGKVPVRRIGGTLSEAIAAGVAANSKHVLPMTRAERHEAAWKLVKIEHGSKAEQARWSGNGQSFIAELRRLKKRLQEAHPGEDLGALWEAKRMDTEEASEEWNKEMEEKEIAEYVERLRKSFGSKLHKRTSSVVAALASIISAQLMADHLGACGDEYGGIVWPDEDDFVNDDF